MKKFLKAVAIIIVSVIVLFVGSAIISGIVSRSRLRMDGFTKEEVQIIDNIKMTQKMVNQALGKDTPADKSWGHLTEVFDEDGTTLLGYSIDSEPEYPYVPKRYYLTKDKELLWWGNISDKIDDEGREHLRTGKGY